MKARNISVVRLLGRNCANLAKLIYVLGAVSCRFQVASTLEALWRFAALWRSQWTAGSAIDWRIEDIEDIGTWLDEGEAVLIDHTQGIGQVLVGEVGMT